MAGLDMCIGNIWSTLGIEAASKVELRCQLSFVKVAEPKQDSESNSITVVPSISNHIGDLVKFAKARENLKNLDAAITLKQLTTT